MCSYLSDCSEPVAFLYPRDSEDQSSSEDDAFTLGKDVLALQEYRVKAMNPNSMKAVLRLHPLEEVAIFGSSSPLWVNKICTSNKASLYSDFVQETESLLERLRLESDSEVEAPPFPLTMSSDFNDLENEILNELKESYQIYCKEPHYTLPSRSEYARALEDYLLRTTEMR
jgi:hypothetical protein